MAAAAPAAPLLAFGPLGWIAYAVAVTGSVIIGGVIVHEMSRSHTRTDSTTRTITDTARQPCRQWTVRIHAQGMIIGGTRSSTARGLPPIVKPSPVTVAEGLVLSTGVLGTLTKTQIKRLSPAKIKLDRFISARPRHGGFLSKKSKYPGGKDDGTGDRFDVDSFGCSPNFIA